MANSIKLTFGYKDTDFTRVYTIGNVADSIVADATAKNAVRNKIKAINQSLSGGTSGGLNTAFRSNDFDASEGIGSFSEIKAATIIEQEVTALNVEESE